MCDEKQLDKILKSVVRFSEGTLGGVFRYAILYGSYARGDFGEESDIDVMIVADMDDERLQSHMMDYSRLATGLALDYGVLLSFVLQDERTLNRWKNSVPYYRNVLAEGVRLSA